MTNLITDIKQIDFEKVSTFLKENAQITRNNTYWESVLPHTSRMYVLADDNGNTEAVMRLVDDNEMCIVHDFCIQNNANASQNARLLVGHLMQYVAQKNFLYTEIFNCPECAVPLLQKNKFDTLDTGMIFDDAQFKEQDVDTNGFTVQTEVRQVNQAGVNDIYDAVGWGARSAEMWQKITPYTNYIVQVLDKKKVIGFARLVEDGQNAMIYDVCVLPEYQKNKIGSMLMSKMSAYVHQHRLPFAGLVVVHENPTAKKFYEKFGFRSVPRVMQLYRDNIAPCAECCLQKSPLAVALQRQQQREN